MHDEEDDIDRRKILRKHPSYGPDWDAAIEFGIDVIQLEENLRLTPEERILQLEALVQLHEEIERQRPRP